MAATNYDDAANAFSKAMNAARERQAALTEARALHQSVSSAAQKTYDEVVEKAERERAEAVGTAEAAVKAAEAAFGAAQEQLRVVHGALQTHVTELLPQPNRRP